MLSIKGTVQDKSYSEYEYRVALLKTCPMAKKKLDQLDIPAIQENINHITAEKSLCESTCGKLIAFIKRTYQFAVDAGDIVRNPVSAKKCLKIPVVAGESTNVLPLSTQDLAVLYTVLNGSPRLKPIVYCMLCAGLRVGEVLALTWDKVCFDAGASSEIVVNRAVKKYKVKTASGTKSEYRIGPPKTKSSVRRVGISPKLRETLLEWKSLQPFHAADKTGMDLVFPKRNGVLQDYDSFNIGFNKYLAKVGLDYHKYHSRVFRHTFASYLVKQGVKVKTLQKLMGHAKIETTFQYYVDTDQDSLNEAIQLIDATLDSPDFTFRNFRGSVLVPEAEAVSGAQMAQKNTA